MSRPQETSNTQTFSMNRPNTFTKLDLTPRRYHFYNVLLFIFGAVFPPLAVAARFGIGVDFWLNVILTICGYIPGHGHNFYIQNIRNNKNHRRTPKWAIRYGLVDDSEIRRKERRSQWAGRYNDRLPYSTYENQPVEEGQVPDRDPSETSVNNANSEPRLWDRRQDEHFYGERRNASGSLSNASNGGSSTRRWHYPANFDSAEVDPSSPVDGGKGKKRGFLGGRTKKDRWALSEDARKGARVPDGEYVGEVRKKKKEKKVKRRKKSHEGVGNDTIEDYNRRRRAGSTSTNGIEEPEDAVGGLYGDRQAPKPVDPAEERAREEQELFGHQF